MKKPAQLGAIDIAAVQSRMLTIRNQQVLLDRDVAALYGVETKALNQAVKRNAERFEDGYLFQLDAHEVENWKSQIVTSNLSEREIASLKMGMRRAPYAFTERGLYMLATILNSPRAVRATKAIIETYAQVRSMVRDMEAIQTEKAGSHDHHPWPRVEHLEDMLAWLDIVEKDWLRAYRKVKKEWPNNRRNGFVPRAVVHRYVPNFPRQDKLAGEETVRKFCELVEGKYYSPNCEKGGRFSART